MIFPRPLRQNDLVLVISPSYAPDAEELKAGIEVLERNGFRVETGAHAGSSWGAFAGSDAERLADLQWALDHPEASMILCSRGGYGMGRIFRSLDFTAFEKKPKWLVGFSDITLLHTLLQERGFAGMHGPMVCHHARINQLPACLKQQDFLVRREKLRYPLTAAFREDIHDDVSGIIVGGNLSLLSYGASGLGPGFFSKRLVFLEDVGESYHKIDRMLDQLFRNTNLSDARAFVLGTFSECPENNFPLRIADMIREKCGVPVPVFTGLPCGHAHPSFPLVLGYHTEIRRSGEDWEFLQAGLPLIS